MATQAHDAGAVNRRPLGLVSLPGETRSVPIARHWARTALAGGGYGDLDDALLLLSEMITNAVLHTSSGCPGGRVTVGIYETDSGLVRLEVTDEGAETVPRQCEPDVTRVDGRGLWLLEELAQSWGFRRIGVCGSLWAEVATRSGCLVSRPEARDD